MATQASAITFLSTPGQAFNDGLGFIQFYFGLPLAMVVLSITVVPIFHKLQVFTAYQYLEERFGVSTRTLTSFLFLLQRGLSTGITIYAPAIILSTVLGWDLSTTIVFIGVAVMLYTITGGNKAVSVTHQLQMGVIFFGMALAAIIAVSLLPADISFNHAVHIAGDLGKLKAIKTDFDLKDRYNLFSGLIGGFFLQLSYFGTDQSQVARFLGGETIAQSRMGLLLNGLVKIPMQLAILFIGIVLFVFYQFVPAPLIFNQSLENQVLQSSQAKDYKSLQQKHTSLELEKKEIIAQLSEQPELKTEANEIQLAIKENRLAAKTLIKQALPKAETQDSDYIFISFVLKYLPHGIIGLLLAVILSAAMSSTSSALSSLGTTTAIDFYQRHFNPEIGTKLVSISRWFILLWSAIAISFALVAGMVENLIQAVNVLGSLFYGTILGIFLVGFYLPYVKGKAVLYGAIIAEAVVIYCFICVPEIGYLWYNLIGCFIVAIVGLLVQSIFSKFED
jgi:Na+/proline symporter